MKKLLYIDSCIRGELSRTKRIADPIVEKLSSRYEVETLTINDLNLAPVQFDEYSRRKDGIVSDEALCWANKIKNADRIVIAAPFWDMSIPASLKTFFELCSLFGVTFDSDDKTCFGLCKAENLLFITTRGMAIKTGSPLEQATPYIKALAWLWGIKGFEVVARDNFDYLPQEEIEKEIESAIKEGLEIAETF